MNCNKFNRFNKVFNVYLEDFRLITINTFLLCLITFIYAVLYDILS